MALRKCLILRRLAQRGLEGRRALIQPSCDLITPRRTFAGMATEEFVIPRNLGSFTAGEDAAAPAAMLTPLHRGHAPRTAPVGREEELATLQRRWQQAKSGEGCSRRLAPTSAPD